MKYHTPEPPQVTPGQLARLTYGLTAKMAQLIDHLLFGFIQLGLLVLALITLWLFQITPSDIWSLMAWFSESEDATTLHVITGPLLGLSIAGVAGIWLRVSYKLCQKITAYLYWKDL